MKQDLKTRIPIAIIYVVLVVGSLLLGQVPSIIVISILFLCCIHEFVTISKTRSLPSDYLPYYIFVGAAVLVPWDELIRGAGQIILIASVLYMVANGLFVMFRARILFVHDSLTLNIVPYLIVPFLICIYMLKAVPAFNYIVLCVFILIWFNDTGAYFTGKTFGKHKLHPRISPAKTWEGLIGGGACTLLAAWAISFYYNYFSIEMWLVLAVVIWAFAVIGDISESAWKRFYRIKDTGTILRGHGGFLDRLDSFIYTIPVISLIIYFMSLS